MRKFGINSFILVVMIVCLISWLITYCIFTIGESYAFGLFVWMPFSIGLSATFACVWAGIIDRAEIRAVSFLCLAVYSVGLLAFAFEGLICLVMAAPIGMFFVWLGFRIGYSLSRSRINRNATMILLFISLPAVMGFDYAHKDDLPEAKPLVTSIEINASPETVWKNVLEFSPLSAPTEFIFKTGIAYPINAKITGKGIGAVRNCNFSTGSFVEPITRWEEPSLLAFDVKDQPEPMKEFSPYDIHPNHLHGYLVSKHGQFKVIALPNGHTQLEGTTWYYNNIKPNIYWNIWSDYIIHKIHTRVLEHIKQDSEATTK